GIAVFSGMLGVTLFGLFLTPVFYVVISKLTHRGVARALKPALTTATVIRLALGTAACGVRRPYVAPNVEPATLQHVDSALEVEQPFDPRWWQQFDDTVLNDLISKALSAN